MAAVDYCIDWFWKRRTAHEPVSEAEARRRHEKREEYTVVVGGFEHPSAVILLARGMVAVYHPDVLIREELEYGFSERNPGRLFLAMAIRRVYCPATGEMVARLEEGRKQPRYPWGQFLAEIDTVIEGTSLTFESDGSVLKQYEHFSDPYKYRDTRFSWNTDSLWLPYPEFGQYDHLLEASPELPWGPGLDGP